jgi:hypothetical protein
MKKLILLFVLSLCWSKAFSADCLVLVVGGARHKGVMAPKDISNAVYTQMMGAARKTGRRTLTGLNQSEGQFKKMILEVGKGIKQSTPVHVVFPDHGPPSERGKIWFS